MRAPPTSATRRSSASDNSSTRSGRPPRRARSSSWNTTTSPLAHWSTSSSTPSAPSTRARTNASTLFSGARALAPRCPMTSGPAPAGLGPHMTNEVTTAPSAN
jgi:hypothetical protein